MERVVRIQELEKIDGEISIVGRYPEEEYVGAIEDHGEYYLVTRREGNIFVKPCVMDVTAEVSDRGVITSAEFYFPGRQENLSASSTPQAQELIASIEAEGKPKGDIAVNQDWDFRANLVDEELYKEIKEMKAEYPTRSVRDGFVVAALEAKANERSK